MESQATRNMRKNPHYAPYCGRCPGLVRMVRTGPLKAKCRRCPARHEIPETPPEATSTEGNQEELRRWLLSRKGHLLTALKGKPAEGATYEDGTPVTGLVNVGWVDVDTGDTFKLSDFQ